MQPHGRSTHADMGLGYYGLLVAIPIGKSLLTSLFTFLLISIRLA